MGEYAAAHTCPACQRAGWHRCAAVEALLPRDLVCVCEQPIVVLPDGQRVAPDGTTPHACPGPSRVVDYGALRGVYPAAPGAVPGSAPPPRPPCVVPAPAADTSTTHGPRPIWDRA